MTRLDAQPDIAKPGEHPIGVQDGLLHPLSREEAPGALEEALALEVEAPGRRLVDVGPAPLAQIQELLHELALEDREVFAVPVGEVRVVVDAPVRGYRGVALVHDARKTAKPGMGRHGVQGRPHLAQHLEARGRLLPRGGAAQWPIDPPRVEARPFGVKGNEVEGRGGLRAVSKKPAEEFVAPSSGAEIARGGGAAHRGLGQRRLHGRRRHVVERVELLGRPAPVENIRLVPQLPQPAPDVRRAVPGHAVLDEGPDEPRPFPVVLGRKRPEPRRSRRSDRRCTWSAHSGSAPPRRRARGHAG